MNEVIVLVLEYIRCMSSKPDPAARVIECSQMVKSQHYLPHKKKVPLASEIYDGVKSLIKERKDLEVSSYDDKATRL